MSHDSAAKTASIFSGIPGNAIEDVKLSNCFFGHKGEYPAEAMGRVVPEMVDGYPELSKFGATPSNGFFIRHLRHLEMAHVEIAPEKPDARPAFWLEDVERADFFAVTAPGEPNFALRKVKDLRILWSRAAKDAGVAVRRRDGLEVLKPLASGRGRRSRFPKGMTERNGKQAMKAKQRKQAKRSFTSLRMTAKNLQRQSNRNRNADQYGRSFDSPG